MATDYLALLPTELVIVICDLVHETHPMQYLGRVSKAFLPLERERTFRNLRITSYKSLARLVEAIHTSPGAGVYVATLHLEDRLRRPRDLPLVRDLASFLALLPNLEEVELDAVLSTDRFRSALQSTPHPALYNVVVRNPLDCRRARSLAKVVSLTAMGSVRYVFLTTLSPELQLFSAGSGLGHYLSLQGDLAGWAGLADVLASLPPLHRLQLRQSRPAHSGYLATLLQLLSHPLSLRDLELRQHSSLADDLSAVLPSFPALRKLDLAAGISTATLLPALKTLPRLSQLTFSYESPLAAAHLLALIDAIASRTLRAIQIDIYVVHRALSSERDEGIATDEGWTDDLTLEGMVSTVEAADVARVCIYGHAVDRARQEQERRRQAGAAAGRAAG
ncbi:hypothetical protein JCM10449v2_007357 [Rhodotorula kratochvilovae]